MKTTISQEDFMITKEELLKLVKAINILCDTQFELRNSVEDKVSIISNDTSKGVYGMDDITILEAQIFLLAFSRGYELANEHFSMIGGSI